MVPRATIRKPACLECLYSEPTLLGVHPKTNSWVATGQWPGMSPSQTPMQNHTLATLPQRQVQQRTRQRPTKSPCKYDELASTHIFYPVTIDRAIDRAGARNFISGFGTGDKRVAESTSGVGDFFLQILFLNSAFYCILDYIVDYVLTYT